MDIIILKRTYSTTKEIDFGLRFSRSYHSWNKLLDIEMLCANVLCQIIALSHLYTHLIIIVYTLECGWIDLNLDFTLMIWDLILYDNYWKMSYKGLKGTLNVLLICVFLYTNAYLIYIYKRQTTDTVEKRLVLLLKVSEEINS